MSEYKPTEEQQAVIDACATGEGVVVQAAAGAGKTSTLRFAADAMAGKRVLYLAYNSAAAKDAARSFPAHVECRTFHSAAGDFRIKYAHRLGGSRRTARQVAEALRVTRAAAIGQAYLSASGLTRIGLDTVMNWCHSADPEIDANHVPHVDGVGYDEREDLQREVLPIARRCWEDIADPEGNACRFDHDHYLKMFQLAQPELPYDTIMLDEAQDSNPCRSDIVLRQNAQRIAIGDDCQQLYAWQGAVNALKDWPAEHVMYLTQSWRFGGAVAERANDWLAELDTDLRVRGNPHLASTIGPIPAPDAVLCRTNAGSIAQALVGLKAGLRVALVGKVDSLIRLCDAAVDLQSGRRTGHPELWAFPSWQAVVRYVEEERSAGADLRVFVELVGVYGAKALRDALEATVDERHADMVVSTGHKSKGREWDRVRIARDFRPPIRYTRDGHIDVTMQPADAMLAYVAVTRAKLALDDTGLAWLPTWRQMAATLATPDARGRLLIRSEVDIRKYAQWRRDVVGQLKPAPVAA